MASQTGNQNFDEIFWILESRFKHAEKMRSFLQSKFGHDKDLVVTSEVKPGEHTAYRKMDVIPSGTTSWDELAAAAVYAGFWVHAEGVTLDGKYWPLSSKATGSHLDLYLIKVQIGDYPLQPAGPQSIADRKEESEYT
jgi:hypothetical protein